MATTASGKEAATGAVAAVIPTGAGDDSHDQAQQQQQPSLLWRLAKGVFDTYVPPHVQRRTYKAPTREEARKTLGKYIHTPDLPIRRWIRNYTREDLLADCIGGFTVAVMLVPQGLAYSILATLPPIYGLYTATLPPIIYALFGTSKHVAVGPVALVSIFYPRACASLGISTDFADKDATAMRAALAPVLSFWVGIVFLICGLLRISKVIRFLSHPVMTGFTSGAAFYIGFSQLKYCFNIAVPHFEYNHQMYTYIVQHGLKDGDANAQAIGAFTFFVLYLLKVLKRDYLPPTPARKKMLLYRAFSYLVTFSTIIVVVATAYWARALHYQGRGVPVVGKIQQGWNPVRRLDFAAFDTTQVFVAAIPLTLIGFIEAFSMARKYALQHKYDININQEAVALGVANLVASPFSVYPCAGNFGRTALAADVGVRTAMANVMVGLVITVVLTRLTQLLYFIPKATLGAVICSAVITLVEWPEFIRAFWIAPVYFLIMASTFLVTAVVDVALGLEFGLGLSVMVLLFQLSSVERKGMGRRPDGRIVPLDAYPTAVERPGVKVYKLTGYLWFGNATKMRDQIYRFMADAHAAARGSEDGELTHIVLDFSGSSGLDLTTMLSLQYIATEAAKLKVKVVLAACSDKVLHNLRQCDLLDAVGGERCAGMCLEDVVDAIEAEKAQQLRQQQDAAAALAAEAPRLDLEVGGDLASAPPANAVGCLGTPKNSGTNKDRNKGSPFYKRMLRSPK